MGRRTGNLVNSGRNHSCRKGAGREEEHKQGVNSGSHFSPEGGAGREWEHRWWKFRATWYRVDRDPNHSSYAQGKGCTCHASVPAWFGPCVSMHPGDKVPAFQGIMITSSLRFKAFW